jgi:hypothetical protein
VVALAFAVVAGIQPAFSSITPQRLDVDFVDDHVTGKALWAIDTQAPLPAVFRTVMRFSATPEKASPILFQPSYVAAAGALRFAAPGAAVVSTHRSRRRVTLTLKGSERTNESCSSFPMPGSSASRSRATALHRRTEPSG